MPIFGITASSNQTTKLTDFYQIATTTLGSAQSSITFDNIPQDYTHLQLRFLARTDRSAQVTDTVLVRYNNDNTTANYTYHEFGGDGSSVYVYGSGSDNNSYSLASGAGASANVFGVGIVDILDYTNTNKNKVFRNIGGIDNNGSGRTGLVSGSRKNTAAITKIVLSPGAGTNLQQYSSFALYGIKG